ncbi:MAG TPA: DNA polymerase IV [Acidimicrobiales bacterium]|nr:DNA polymerase IV [Acidimicrobiales bacterium]
MKPSDTWNSASEGPSLAEAPILHVDLDAFFASVEVLDDPSLRGRPVAVGGAGARGVIASASYEARRYGVTSGMPSVTALRRCSGLVIRPGRFDRYEELSRQFRGIVEDLTHRYEAIGLDEVFCDLSGLVRLGVRPVPAARALRARVIEEMHLDCGIGVARNKLFAKLASREAKSRVVAGELVAGPGVFYVDHETEARWLAELPVRALWGVGPATAAKLGQLGLTHVRDLARVSHADLTAHLGPALASTLSSFARGEDPREVVADRRAKSLGHEQTFARSLVGDEVIAAARVHAGVVSRALRERHQLARTISVVVRFDDRESLSRSQSLAFGVDDDEAIFRIAEALLAGVDTSRAVRLLGVHASGFLARGESEVQLSFAVAAADETRQRALDESRARQVAHAALRDAVDEVRRRYGNEAVSRASELGELATQRGRSAFGPGLDALSDGDEGPDRR